LSSQGAPWRQDNLPATLNMREVLDVLQRDD
jgi:hypothetical protein